MNRLKPFGLSQSSHRLGRNRFPGNLRERLRIWWREVDKVLLGLIRTSLQGSRNSRVQFPGEFHLPWPSRFLVHMSFLFQTFEQPCKYSHRLALLLA